MTNVANIYSLFCVIFQVFQVNVSLWEEVFGIMFHEETLIVAEQGVPVVSHVELLVCLPRVPFVNTDQLVMPWVCRKEIS